MYCTHCGSELQDSDRYCPVCGKLQGQPESKPPQESKAGNKNVLILAAGAVVVLAAIVVFYLARGRQVLDASPAPAMVENTAVVAEPTPTERAPITLNLTPQGGGGYSSLEEALADVPAGSTIYLSLGTYELSQAVSVDIPITMIGAGAESTIVTGSDATHVIRFNGEGPLHLEGIHFQHEGATVADVVVVNTTDAEIRNCSFSGAYRGDQEDVYGGLWITGETEGVVESSEASGNDAVGFLVDEDANVTLFDVIAMNNTSYGIYFLERSSGEVQESYASSNDQAGILLSTEGSVVLSRNTCRDNAGFGISITNAASPVVSENYVEMNGLSGILVKGSVTALIEDNSLSGNGESGLVYSENAGGTASGNVSFDNDLQGITVQGEAAPVLSQNACYRNEDHGIAYFAQAGGTASNNDCYENVEYGIGVMNEAAPTLDGNHLHDNGMFGLYYSGSAGGTAEANRINGNAESGIYVGEDAQPELLDNEVFQNGLIGITYLEHAGGHASGNICWGNAGSGIGVQGDAAPVVENNELRDNEQSGLFFAQQSSGVGRGNAISGNGYYCIHVFDQASPSLEGNTCSGNAYGIVVEDTASPTLGDNTENAPSSSSSGSGALWISGDARYADDPPMQVAYANTRYASPPSAVTIRDSGGEFWRMNEWVALMNAGDWIEATHSGTGITSVGVQFWGDNDDGYARVLVDGAERWSGNTYGENGNYPGGAFVNYLYFTNLGSGPHTIRVEAVGQTGGGAGDNVTIMFFGFE